MKSHVGSVVGDKSDEESERRTTSLLMGELCTERAEAIEQRERVRARIVAATSVEECAHRFEGIGAGFEIVRSVMGYCTESEVPRIVSRDPGDTARIRGSAASHRPISNLPVN
jgi:hypothetical protein